MAAAIFVFAVLATMHRAAGEEMPPRRVAVIVSQKIRPYLQALDGIQERIGNDGRFKTEVIYLDDDSNQDAELVAAELKKNPCNAALAVGPEAMQLIWRVYPNRATIKVFCMVLNPEKLAPSQGDGDYCGVSLNIPGLAQLRAYTRRLPDLKRIGMIYDPDNNAGIAYDADQAAHRLGVAMVHLKVQARSQIQTKLQVNWQNIDALWMIPDRTVISESLVQYIVKEGLANGVAVLGYNRFFIESGAAMALVRDYSAIGRQAADSAIYALDYGTCRSVVPEFEVVLNTEVLDALGMAYRESKPFPALERP